MLEALRYINLVIPQSHGDDKIRDLRLYNIDTYVMGEDEKRKSDF